MANQRIPVPPNVCCVMLVVYALIFGISAILIILLFENNTFPLQDISPPTITFPGAKIVSVAVPKTI